MTKNKLLLLFSCNNDMPWQRYILNNRIILFVVLCAINMVGGTYYGYNMSSVGVVLAPLSQTYGLYPSNSTVIDIGNQFGSYIVQGLVAASVLFGGMIGAMTGIYLVDVVGRRGCLLVISVTGIIGIIGETFIPAYPAIIIFRVILGLSIGLSNVACSILTNELSSIKQRGIIGPIFSIGLNIGSIAALALGYGFLYVPLYAYNLIFGVTFIWPIAFIFLYVIIPESPIVVEMKASGGISKASWRYLSSAMKLLYLDKKSIWNLIIGLVICANQMITGATTYMIYAPNIIRASGIAENISPIISSIVLLSWSLFTVLLTFWWCGRIPRRVSILIGTVIMFLTNLGLGFDIYFAQGEIRAYIAIPLFAIYYIGLNMSYGSLTYTILSELFPAETRALAVSQLSSVMWLLSLLMNLFFLPISTAIGAYSIIWFFAGISFISIFILAIFLPETKKISLDKQSVISDIELNNTNP